jgi:hypothetical protein
MLDYRIADARKPLSDDVVLAFVDLAWARPHRNGVYVTYPTYSPPELWKFVDAVYNSLTMGGWALFDCDDWLLPRLINYLRNSWGDVAATYSGGGYRRTGAVVYSDHPGGGEYFTNGGYHVVFAHKGETSRKTGQRSKIITKRPPQEVRQAVDWGTLKPIEPYKKWMQAVTEPKELVYIPCAGTAPGLIAAEQLNRKCIAVDSEDEAKMQYENRRSVQMNQQLGSVFEY